MFCSQTVVKAPHVTSVFLGGMVYFPNVKMFHLVLFSHWQRAGFMTWVGAVWRTDCVFLTVFELTVSPKFDISSLRDQCSLSDMLNLLMKHVYIICSPCLVTPYSWQDNKYCISVHPYWILSRVHMLSSALIDPLCPQTLRSADSSMWFL